MFSLITHCTIHSVTSPNILNYVFIDLISFIFVSIIYYIILSTDQQIDGFTFMGTSIKELRETISTIGDHAKCTRLKEELENLEVRMKPNR